MTTGQIVRWIPHEENRDVAKYWGGFCKREDGGKGNNQLKDGFVNKDLVSLGASKVDKRNGKASRHLRPAIIILTALSLRSMS